jgi:hypothetical protein
MYIMVKRNKDYPDGTGYPTEVDYDLSMEDVIREGRYRKVDSNINSKNFPPEKKGKDRIIALIVELQSRPVFEDLCFEAELASIRERYELVNLREALAVFKQHDEIRAVRPIFALGSRADIGNELLAPEFSLHPESGKTIGLMEV